MPDPMTTPPPTTEERHAVEHAEVAEQRQDLVIARERAPDVRTALAHEESQFRLAHRPDAGDDAADDAVRRRERLQRGDDLLARIEAQQPTLIGALVLHPCPLPAGPTAAIR